MDVKSAKAVYPSFRKSPISPRLEAFLRKEPESVDLALNKETSIQSGAKEMRDAFYVRPLERKYDPKSVEMRVERFWKESKIYERVKELRRHGPKFYFLDGPPFPSSDTPHIGTCWNKVIKDVFIRYKRARGYNVRDQPGYDCHGLPIELQIEKEFGVKHKTDIEDIGLDKFTAACKQLAKRNSESMSRIFRELGVWMDWENPYMTHDDEYIESAWWLLKQAHQKGLLEHGMKVVHWCPRCETVLSDYEVSQKYSSLKDPSIYVKFPVKGKEREFIVVWTTTPWTLPSNVAVMVHPEFNYVRARIDDEVYILAEARLEAISQEAGLGFEVLEAFPGRQLEGLEYEHPLKDEVTAQANLVGGHVVVLSSEYVNLEQGTGCVHSAPGHGEEDYAVGLRYRLPVLMLVDDSGRFYQEAGKYAGKSVRDANGEIVEDLRRKGYLLFSSEIEHRAPLCWRCDTPLLLRATNQWFIRVTRFKENMLKEVEEARWIPEWAGAAQFKNWLKGLRDWVVSRQRFWGTPLPAWVCKGCSSVEVVGSKAELYEKAAEVRELKELHVPWVDEVILKCNKCGGPMRRVKDVLVGWLDSGIASFASLNYPQDQAALKAWWPVDFIAEGRDQISGWFFSLLEAGMVALNQIPYTNVLMHGFMLDESGREMHKSLGNYVAPQEVLERFAREPLRFYLLQNTTWEDLRFSWKGLKEALGDLTTIWNAYVFASSYMALDRYSPQEWPLEKVKDHLYPEDRWLLSRVEGTVKRVTEALEGYRAHDALRAIKGFLLEDVSRTYIRTVRRRVWVEKEDPEKMAAYAVLYYALKRAIILMAPFLPFVAEDIYQNVFRQAEPASPESVHMLDWPSFNESLYDPQVEEQMEVVRSIVSAIASARMKAKMKLRQPVRRIYVASDSDAVRKAVRAFGGIISEQGNCKRLLLTKAMDRRLIRISIEPNLNALDRDFGVNGKALAKRLLTLKPGDAIAMRNKLLRGEPYVVKLRSKKFELSEQHIGFSEDVAKGFVEAEFPGGRVFVDTRLTVSEVAEGLARDIVRRLQQMRKEMDLPIEAYVNALIVVPDDKAKRLIEKMRRYIVAEVRVKELTIARKEGPLAERAFDYVKAWDLEGEKFTLGLKTVSS